jgi:hypothetical protein
MASAHPEDQESVYRYDLQKYVSVTKLAQVHENMLVKTISACMNPQGAADIDTLSTLSDTWTPSSRSTSKSGGSSVGSDEDSCSSAFSSDEESLASDTESQGDIRLPSDDGDEVVNKLSNDILARNVSDSS